MGSWKRLCVIAIAAAAFFYVEGCGGGASPTVTVPPATTYTIGGTVSGLAGAGLVLQDNGGNNLAISASGSFTFSTAIASGSTYAVTVLTQPSSPAQTCAVTSGSGSANANVTSVLVTCTTTFVPPPTYTIGGTVSGLAGSGLVLQDNGGDNLAVTANGSFTFATAIASGSAYAVTVLTQPPAPVQSCIVTNGRGTANAIVTNMQISCLKSGEWTWIGGSNTANSAGTYGTPGSTSASNVPSARCCAVTWTDESGNFWLFGGIGQTLGGNDYALNDFWEYSEGEWTLVSGSNGPTSQQPSYGTLGVAAHDNLPTWRQGSGSWTDSEGSLWLFGGQGFDLTNSWGTLNDLWKYSGGEWTWMGGSNLVSQPGTYGTLGSAAASNIPSSRAGAASWTDLAGNFWLFGGFTMSLTGGPDGQMNDLWEYSKGQWTWKGGSNLVNQKGSYGTLNMAASSNIPGARTNSSYWKDKSGNFWLFGGQGYDSTGVKQSYGSGEGNGLNDLWEYSGGQWIWKGGSNLADQQGSYGTLRMASASNVPSERYFASAWTDASGNFWLFGGSYEVPVTGTLNDLWKYSGGEWTWVSGANTGDQAGVYGTLGAPAASDVPGSRESSMTFTDGMGNLWLFGGATTNGPLVDSSGTMVFPTENDLWVYQP